MPRICSHFQAADHLTVQLVPKRSSDNNETLKTKGESGLVFSGLYCHHPATSLGFQQKVFAVLLSMTGFGNASVQSDLASVNVELKAVNNRYLKVLMKLPDVASRFEPDIEKLVRSRIARGSVQLNFRIRLHGSSSGFRIDEKVLNGYVNQLNQLSSSQPSLNAEAPAVTSLLSLPGIITETDVDGSVIDSLWPLIEAALDETLKHFEDFRRSEGESMRSDLKAQAASIATELEHIEALSPTVVSDYRSRLLERVQKAITESDGQIEESDLIREVAVFADRCDINEEMTRLKCHLEQYENFLNSEQSMGRKLEFLGQEVFREINTIGSKANNVEIAHHVVEMKAAVERIREILQNVE